jgi:hypothetical protein
MVSIPVYTGNSTLYQILGDSIIYHYDGNGYHYDDMFDSLNNTGYGYWVWHSDTILDSISVVGVKCGGYKDEILRGFNQIGSIAIDTGWIDNYCYKDTNSTITNFLTCVGWDADSGYVLRDVIRKTYGYFALGAFDGTLHFPGPCDTTSSDSSSFLLSFTRLLLNTPSTTSNAIPPDSIHFRVQVDWANNKVFVTDRNNKNALENVLVAFQVGDSVDIQYTGTKESNNYGWALTDLDIEKDDSTWIVVFKPGYFEYIIHPFGSIENGDTMWGDVKIYGDVVAQTGDTLTILPGTNIYANPGDAEWNYPQSSNKQTEIIADGGCVIGFEKIIYEPEDGGEGGNWGCIPTFLPECVDTVYDSISVMYDTIATLFGVAADTTTASHTDLLCDTTDCTMWVFGEIVPRLLLKENTGSWTLDTIADSAMTPGWFPNGCGENNTKTYHGCPIATSFFASDAPFDTIFFLLAKDTSTCIPGDSVAMYSDSINWTPICAPPDSGWVLVQNQNGPISNTDSSSSKNDGGYPTSDSSISPMQIGVYPITIEITTTRVYIIDGFRYEVKFISNVFNGCHTEKP